MLIKELKYESINLDKYTRTYLNMIKYKLQGKLYVAIFIPKKVGMCPRKSWECRHKYP